MYQQFLTTGLTNALLGTVLAILVWGIFRMNRNCQLASILWIAVFLKFLTPPFWEVPLLPAGSEPEAVATSEDLTQPESGIPETGDLMTSTPTVSFTEEKLVDEEPDNPTEPILITDAQSGDELSDKKTLEIAEADSSQFAKSEAPNFEEPAEAVTAPVISEDKTASEWSFSAWIRPIPIFTVWAAGFLLNLFFMIYRGFQFDRRLSRLEFKEHSLQVLADQIAKRMGMEKSPLVRLVAAPVTPMIWSFGRKPVILMPEKLVEEVSRTKIAMILTHELAHIKRKDHLFRWVELIVIAMYWWFPVVQWIRKHWHIIQEECCDAWVIRLYPDGQVEYGETLLESARFLQRTPTPVWANELWTRNSLRERIETMLKMKKVSPLSRSMKLAVLLLLGPLMLLSVGQVSQETETPEAETAVEKVQGEIDFLVSTSETEVGKNSESQPADKKASKETTDNEVPGDGTLTTENYDGDQEKGSVRKPSHEKENVNSIAVYAAADQKRLAGRLIDGWFEARKKLKSGEFVSIQHVESSNRSNGYSQYHLVARAIFDPQQLTLSYSRNNLDRLSLFGKEVKGMEHYMRKRPDDYLRFATDADMFGLFRPSYQSPAIPLSAIDKNAKRSPYSYRSGDNETWRIEINETDMHLRYDDNRVTGDKIPDYLEKFRNPQTVESLGEGRFRLTHVSESPNQNALVKKTVDVLTINEKKDYTIEERWIKTASEPVDLSSQKNSGLTLKVQHVKVGDLWLPMIMIFEKHSETANSDQQIGNSIKGKVFFNWKKLNQPLAKNERGEFKLEPLNFDELKLNAPGQDNGLEIMAYQEGPTNAGTILLSDQGRKGRIVQVGPVTPAKKDEPKIEESVALLDDLNVYLVEKDQEKQNKYFTQVLGQIKVYPATKTTEKILKDLLKALNDEKPEVRKTAVDVLTDYCIQNHAVVSNRSSRKIYREVLDTLINRMYSDPDPMMKYEIASKLKNVELLACAQVMLEVFYQSDDVNQYYSLGLMQSMSAPWDLVRDVLVNANRKLSRPDEIFWNKLAEKLVKIAGKKEITEEEYQAAFRYSASESAKGATEKKTPEERLAYFRQEITEIMSLALMLNSTDLTEAFIMTANNANEEELEIIQKVLEKGMGTNKYGLHLKLTDEAIDQAAKMIESENKGVRETGALILKAQLKLDRGQLEIKDRVVPNFRNRVIPNRR